MLTLFYSPHSTSVDNEAKRASGHADIPLSELGIQQAKQLGQHYDKETLAAIFCSDLQRATHTAHLAFGHRNLPIIPDARLREYDYGQMTQYPVSQVEAEFPHRITEPFPDGESLEMVVQRIGSFLQDASKAYDNQTIVVIGHRATRYGIKHWCQSTPLAELVNTPWPWLDIPIWRYEYDPLTQRKK